MRASHAGLSAKVPAVHHSALTHLLVFHRFVQQNESFRAVTHRGQFLAQDDGYDHAVIDIPEGPDDWKIAFGPMNWSDLHAGIMLKERLVKLLDHPGLKNHLLKERNILLLLVRMTRGVLVDTQ